MDLSRVILGPVVTEKSERMKLKRTYTLLVPNEATKIEVKNALQEFYDVEVASVRVMRTVAKSRPFGRGDLMVKRKSAKKVLVTLSKESRALDLASFSS